MGCSKGVRKKMKTFDKILIIVGIIIILIAGLCVGRYIFPLIPKPTIEVKERIVKDTITVEKTIKIFETSKPQIIRDSTQNIYSIVDSVKGTQNEVDYKIKHTTTNNNGFLSNWEINLKPLVRTIKEYVVKDSIRTIVDTKYFAKPFFMDEWFYASIIELGIIVLLIIF